MEPRTALQTSHEPPPVPVLRQINPVDGHPSYLFKIQFNIILSSTPISSQVASYLHISPPKTYVYISSPLRDLSQFAKVRVYSAKDDCQMFINGFNAQHVSRIVTRSCRGMSHRVQAFYAISRRAQGRDKNYTNYKTEPQTKSAM